MSPTTDPLRGLGFGCMRLSTDADRDEARSLLTLAAALDAGATTLDTAHAYGLGPNDMGHNERLIRRALEGRPATHVVTKCGMRRPEGQWQPDGRAKAIAEDAEASAEALGRPPDLLLLHAPDPRVPVARSVRALASAHKSGLARHIGLSNVSLTQLREAMEVAPIAAVEVALGFFDDACVRGGVARFCLDHGIQLIAHSPFGGAKRAARVGRDPVLVEVAAMMGATPAQVFLAYLLRLHPKVLPIPGARNPETAANAMAAARLPLDDRSMAALDQRFPALAELRGGPLPQAAPSPGSAQPEVVVIMGLPGSGKSRRATPMVESGYQRLNRDLTGGSLREISRSLDELLSGGAPRVVLDNTYLSLVSRHDLLKVARRHGARVRGVFCEISTYDAQVNLATRWARGGHEVLPASFFRMLRQLERPTLDEGFAELEVVPFVREIDPHARVGVVVAWEAVEPGGGSAALSAAPAGAPVLIIAWRPQATPEWLEQANGLAAQLSRETGRIVELGICSHPGGPPTCWCRPPLPGLWVEFAERHRLESRRSFMFGSSAAHRTMASGLGMTWLAP